MRRRRYDTKKMKSEEDESSPLKINQRQPEVISIEDETTEVKVRILNYKSSLKILYL